jgi:hypothetical protein
MTTRSEHEEQDERERPVATANHRRGISDMMTRSEREDIMMSSGFFLIEPTIPEQRLKLSMNDSLGS